MKGHRRQSKAQPEQKLVNAILDWLKYHKIFAFRVRNGGTYDPTKKIWRLNTACRGISDIIGILPRGKFMALEVKTATGRVSEHQRDFLDMVAESGGFGAVIRSMEDLERLVMPFLKRA